MIALNLEDIKKSIQSFKSDYILVDTPGQLELFVFRESGKYTVDYLNPEKSIICYLLDPALAKTASGFASQILLAITTNFRLNKPQINVLTKSDMLSDEGINMIKKWSEYDEELYSSITNEESSIYREMSEGISRLIADFGGQTKLIPVSKDKSFGIEDIYTYIQLQFQGGEDLLKD
jgi:hypothetical protein